uniref:Uncharacterized protein n=1 Tax=Setaria italica TaxID=4555 RepID=K3Y3T8_SETIT
MENELSGHVEELFDYNICSKACVASTFLAAWSISSVLIQRYNF